MKRGIELHGDTFVVTENEDKEVKELELNYYYRNKERIDRVQALYYQRNKEWIKEKRRARCSLY